MARRPRLDVPDVPQHIVQRGINRAACFFEPWHRHFYLGLLRDAAQAADLAIHAYVLMTNHVHILATPRRTGAISTVMQSVGIRYVQVINKVMGRTGSLFQGRFKSHLVQSESYLLCCYRYIELNPVRAGIAADPSAYPWSSYRHNAHGERNPMITWHPAFADLGRSAADRYALYRSFVDEGVRDSERDVIRAHLNQNRALGDAAFRARIAAATGLPAAVAPRGRPPKP